MRTSALALALMLASCATPRAPEPATAAAPVPSSPPPSFAVRVTGSGRPMILIPGLGCGGDVWDGAVARWSGRYQMHVLTLPGFAGQPAVPAPVLERVRQDLLRYLDDQRLVRPVIIGHSLGGALAMWLAATAPDRVGPIISVEGLPFVSDLFTPGATADSARPQADLLRRMLAAQSPAQFAAQNRAQLANMISRREDLDKVAASSARSDPAAVGQALYELMTTDLRDDVAAIRTPLALLIGGYVDQTTALRQIAKAPDNRLLVVAQARHFVMLDAPDAFYKMVETFLAQPAGGRAP